MDNDSALAPVALPEQYNYLAPDSSEIRELTQAKRGSLAHCRLPINAVSSPVRHQTVEEIWYFLSGVGEVWRKLGDTFSVSPVRAGISLSIPVGASFQFRNIGQEPLDFIIATIPPWPGKDEAISVAGNW